jgi:hypothetical protein
MPNQTIFIEVFGPLAIAFLLWVIVGGARTALRQFRSRETKAQLQAARDAFRARLIHPNPTEVEQGIAAILPQRLLTLYEDHQTLLTERLEIRRPNSSPDAPSEWLESFLPMDMQSQELTINFAAQSWGQGFCFATDGAGNFYWIPASDARQPDAPVHFASRNSSRSPQNSFATEQVAPSLDTFLSWPRTPHSPGD